MILHTRFVESDNSQLRIYSTNLSNRLPTEILLFSLIVSLIISLQIVLSHPFIACTDDLSTVIQIQLPGFSPRRLQVIAPACWKRQYFGQRPLSIISGQPVPAQQKYLDENNFAAKNTTIFLLEFKKKSKPVIEWRDAEQNKAEK